MITEEFNVTNTMELNQELEKEENIDYYYNEEEEEEEEEKEEKAYYNETNKQNWNQKNINKKDCKKEIIKGKSEKDKNSENDIEKEKEIINNENKINKLSNMKNEYSNKTNNVEGKESNIFENKNGEGTKEETTLNTQNTENSQNAKQQIIEEIDTTIPKKNNNILHNEIEEEEKEEDRIIQSFNQNIICHRLIPKGSDLDITQKAHFKCYKIKTKTNIMSFITGNKKIVVPYIILIDENYYYMAKDKIVNQKSPYLRRIGNKYNLLKLSNFQATKKGDDYEFAFEFVNEDIFDRVFKLLYFTPKEAEVFYDVLRAILGKISIEIPEKLEGNEEEEEGEDGEEFEEGEEEGEEYEEQELKLNKIGVKDNEKKVEYNFDVEKVNNIENTEKMENEIKEGNNSFKEDNKEVRDVDIID